MTNGKSSLKEKLPLIFLTAISVWWAAYYSTETPLNDDGEANFEWLYLLDSLVVMPLLCLVCIENKRQAGLKILVYGCLAVFVGSFIIPEQNKFIWHFLDNGRYALVAIFVIFELVAIGTILLAIKTSLVKGAEPDKAISGPVEAMLGKGLLADLLTFEARVWVFALFARNVRCENYPDVKQFFYCQKDGASSNAPGFILILLLELPLLHLVLHFVASPWIANAVTLTTLCSLVFFTAEYRAMKRRPIGVDESNLIIRYGVFKSRNIPFSNIAEVDLSEGFIPRDKSVMRFNFSGYPNVRIKLKETLEGAEMVYLGVDFPHLLIDYLRRASSNR